MLTPVIAVLLTMLVGALIFYAARLSTGRGAVLGDLRRAADRPLQMAGPRRQGGAADHDRASGSSIGYRANVWNIGAEGQYIIGGLAGTGVALADLAPARAGGSCR